MHGLQTTDNNFTILDATSQKATYVAIFMNNRQDNFLNVICLDLHIVGWKELCKFMPKCFYNMT